jgi:transposase-like protein
MIQKSEVHNMTQRKKFTPEFKAQVALEIISGVKSAADACRQYELKSSVVSEWKTTLIANAAKIFNNSSDKSQEQERIAELERLVGRQAMEIEILKKTSSILRFHQRGSGI